MYFLILQYNLMVLEQPDIHAENINSLFFLNLYPCLSHECVDGTGQLIGLFF